MVALVVAGALSLGLVGPAAAQVNVGDGLVNVQVGDIILLQDVNIGIAALVVATICDVQVGPINVLARSVDRTGVASAPPCDVSDGTNSFPIIITQN